MKKLIWLVCLLLIAAQTPPQLPSSFYGWISPNQPAGTVVSAWTGDVRLASASVMQYNGATVYAINVPCTEGDILTFKVGSKVAGLGVCHIGTNARLDLGVLAKVKRR